MVGRKLNMRLGDLLVDKHIITNEQLMQALSSQKKNGS
jgi:MSHA biogenesis protein MshE